MRFDVITIFPDFFQVADLSLLGKAQAGGHLQVQAHDLREWATDRHRTVDDAPYGGGAGMVMRPDVWGRAIDQVAGILPADLTEEGRAEAPAEVPTEVAADGRAESPVEAPAETGGGTTIDPSPTQPQARGARRVLAIPTPAGYRLTQDRVAALVGCEQVIIACGRYEGIDQRVADHYRAAGDLEVFEYSIGDYVLNGGEVAALVLIEALARLQDGFMSNPESLREESFADGLLEYPSYTRPGNWRGAEVPAVLTSGDHARIEGWRDVQKVRRTAERRPDLIPSLDPRALTGAQRAELVALGWVWARGDAAKPSQAIGQEGEDQGAGKVAERAAGQWQRVNLRTATLADLADLVALAQRTFPAACPPELDQGAIDQHLENELNETKIRTWLADTETQVKRQVTLAEVAGTPVGYVMVESYAPDYRPDYLPCRRVEAGAHYLSKCYVDAPYRGSGLAAALVTRGCAGLPGQVVTTTHVGNHRAREFYKSQGFKRVGRRVFLVGEVPHEDVVLARQSEH